MWYNGATTNSVTVIVRYFSAFYCCLGKWQQQVITDVDYGWRWCHIGEEQVKIFSPCPNNGHRLMAKPNVPILLFYIPWIMFIFILTFLNQLLMCCLSHISSRCVTNTITRQHWHATPRRWHRRVPKCVGVLVKQRDGWCMKGSALSVRLLKAKQIQVCRCHDRTGSG